METVEELRRKTSRCDALVAVGSGTINDLCKYASFLDGKPYVVFPTAASMNGYLSANTSITVDGYKKTIAAHMPQAVFCDMGVIAAAPSRLNKSGLGDSLARPTAQADWLLSHLLLGTPYNETPFELLKPLEPHLHENARGIAGGDAQSLELLMQTLLLSGLGMTIAGGSYPASQGEHMIAHAMEMVLPASGRKHHCTQHHFTAKKSASHAGHMAHRQEKSCSKSRLSSPGFSGRHDRKSLFGAKVKEEASKVYTRKQELAESARSKASVTHWEEITGRIRTIWLSPDKIHAILSAMGAPDTAKALGWNPVEFVKAANHARFLRDRFTFLDLQS